MGRETLMASASSRQGLLIAVGLCATLLLHGALLAVVFVGRANAGRVARPQEFGQVVEVQAVKFGSPRDLRFLPHKEAPPPPRPAPKLALTDNARALPALKAPEELPHPPEDPLTRVHRFDDPAASRDNTGSAVEEGDRNGLRGGTATVGKGPLYLQHLVAAVQNAWVIPNSFSDAQLVRLKAQACVRIDGTGRVVEFHLSAPSGNERYDSTLLDALATLEKLEPPTDEPISPGGPTVKQVVTDQGVCLSFQKTKAP